MKKSWKKGIAAAMRVLLAAGMAGCGQTNTANSTATSGDAATTAQTEVAQSNTDNGDLTVVKILGRNYTYTGANGKTVTLKDWSTEGKSKRWDKLSENLAAKGVKLELDLIQFDTTIQTMAASGELFNYDMINITPLDDKTKLNLVKQGQLQSISDIWETYSDGTYTDFINSDAGQFYFKHVALEDGKCYWLTDYETGSYEGNPTNFILAFQIRQDWLDALGLDVPRTWDELAEVAKAFVTRDPDGNGENDTIGILGPGNSDHMNAVGGNQFGLDPLFSCFQSYPQYWLKSEDGSVEYGSIQPETKTALENISKLYADGVIDPETLVRSDSKEPLLAGKVGIFFGPWWCAYTFADTTLSGSADWRAYFTPLSEDGKYYTHMAEPTTQYVVASKDCKNPEAAFKIINYLVANEQKWVEEGVTSTEMGTGDFYPLYNTYDNADEIETSTEALTKYLAGDISMDDVDFSTHKLLKNDMEAVTKLKKKPYDDFSLKYWNLDSDLAKTNLPRLVAIMVGDAPLVNEEYVPIYNSYDGRTKTMDSKWANLKKLEEETFAKIITGKVGIDAFDSFVEEWKASGGDEITKEVQEELDAQQ